MYQEKANEIKISKCNWYKFSVKFSLNLEKQRALQNQVRTLLHGQNEITNKNQVNHQLHLYKTLLTEKLKFQNENITAYLNRIRLKHNCTRVFVYAWCMYCVFIYVFFYFDRFMF